MSSAKVIWRTAMSMDGRIASAEDRLDFLDTIDDQSSALDDFTTFLSGIDGILLGAGTLRWLIRNGHSWPHGDIPTWLISHDRELEKQVGETPAPFKRFEGNVAELLAEIDAAGHQRVWLAGGGEVAGQLLQIDRIDEVEVTIAPVPLGAGPSLFGGNRLPLRKFTPTKARRTAGNAIEVTWLRNRFDG